MLVVLLSTGIAAFSSFGLGRLDRRLTRGRSKMRGLSASVTAFLALWTLAFITLAIGMRVPGAYGPVQYWGEDAEALRFALDVRANAMGVSLFSIVSASICFLSTIGVTIGEWGEARKARASRRPISPEVPLELWLVPGIAIVLAILGFILFVRFGMMPDA